MDSVRGCTVRRKGACPLSQKFLREVRESPLHLPRFLVAAEPQRRFLQTASRSRPVEDSMSESSRGLPGEQSRAITVCFGSKERHRTVFVSRLVSCFASDL